MTYKQWKWRTLWGGLVGVVLGFAAMGIAAIGVGSSQGTPEVWAFAAGSLGVLVAVIGGMLIKWNVAGPVPPSIPDAPESVR